MKTRYGNMDMSTGDFLRSIIHEARLDMTVVSSFKGAIGQKLAGHEQISDEVLANLYPLFVQAVDDLNDILTEISQYAADEKEYEGGD